ncbi:hypothetical protein RHGRI_036130 [Rhododendron griersonianum]|uniref:Endonuclease/exonuclease/phosphatase domain-containing protein n=1 Tax=Rhododendron griersonianum TaxID=479676 RepID=A0AAV6HPS5_9ERIC|nr:hypothetical protein RHGRI_036130 [Rhododendron griersonianum]
MLDKIQPPRPEDTGIEDYALPPDSIKEAFLKAAATVVSRATLIFEKEEERCVEDPRGKGGGRSVGVSEGVDPPPRACVAEKGGGVGEAMRIPKGKGGSGRKQLAVNKRKGGGAGTVRIEERDGELLPRSGKRRLKAEDGETSQVSRLKKFYRLHSPDVVFLMETKNSDHYLVWLQKHLSVKGGFFVSPVGLAGGLCIYWKKEVSFQLIKSNSVFIDCFISIGQHQCRMTFVHAQNSLQERRDLWEELLGIAHMESSDWLIGGDFNAILHQDEKFGGLQRQAWELSDFQRFVQESSLIDLGYVGFPFTWNNKRSGRENVRVRLDRFLASSSWRIHHPNAVVKHLAPGGSNHCPILLDSVCQVGRFKQRFIFDMRWGGYEECAVIVRRAWQRQVHGSRWFQIHEKIKACRMGFLHWRKQRPLNSRHNKEGLGSKLQHLFECPDFNREECSLTETLFKRAFKDEEIYWRDRARSNWLKAGDRNTTFFHAQTIQRRQQSRLVGPEDQNGCWREGNQAVREIACDYFQNLFSSDGISNVEAAQRPRDHAADFLGVKSKNRRTRANHAQGRTKQLKPRGFLPINTTIIGNLRRGPRPSKPTAYAIYLSISITFQQSLSIFVQSSSA